jgi:hypothetical protein
MAARKLAGFVHVHEPDGTSKVFGPDDVVPERYAKQITNPDAWAKPEEEAEPDGSPSEAWTVPQLVAYAKDHEIDLGEATKKADVLVAIKAAEAGDGNPAV